ncbi:YvrJ family protein [Bacillus clarus]|uniref:YvrJ family protein n=1 Tax=Bacillus clarus TaxID=2338372 RepID=A0A090YT97_9BACI|nr:YvrJ family protein [Bacillus clarus]KFN01610.1 yvrJ family protein [Bacillus clarus]RFT66223.1 YvrJ family protein [Bacillus clarus]
MDAITFQSIIKSINNLGFPVVIAIYLLVRFERKIVHLTEAINKLRDAMNKKGL